MRRLFPLLLVSTLIVAGSACRRRSQPATPPSQPSDAPATAPTASPSAPPSQAAPATSTPSAQPGPQPDRLPTAPPGSSRTYPVNQPLTEALQRHLEATGTFPADFNALVTGKYISTLPQPPAGKRFAVDRANLQVVLMNQ